MVRPGQQEADAGRDRAVATDDQPFGPVGVKDGVAFERCRIVRVVVVAVLPTTMFGLLTSGLRNTTRRWPATGCSVIGSGAECIAMKGGSG